jgi:hypothetical protein
MCFKYESCICFFYCKVAETQRNNLSFVCFKTESLMFYFE